MRGLAGRQAPIKPEVRSTVPWVLNSMAYAGAQHFRSAMLLLEDESQNHLAENRLVIAPRRLEYP